MLKVENVAAPDTAATVVVPESAAPAVPVPGVIATATFPVKLVTALPPGSSALTIIAGAIVVPAVVVAGDTVKPSRLAAPTATSNGALVAPVRPAELTASVYPAPALSMLSVEKLAIPATAVTTDVPDNVPPPGFV